MRDHFDRPRCGERHARHADNAEQLELEAAELMVALAQAEEMGDGDELGLAEGNENGEDNDAYAAEVRRSADFLHDKTTNTDVTDQIAARMQDAHGEAY